MPNAMSIIARRRLVKLVKKTGPFIAVLATAASGLPIAGVAMGIADAIRSVSETLKANREHAEKLRVSVIKCNRVLEYLVKNLNDDKHSADFDERAILFLEDIMDGYFHILDAIRFRCDKWSNKKFPKQLWSAKKYEEEFTSLQAKIDTYMPILLEGAKVVEVKKMLHTVQEVKKTNETIEDMVKTLHQESKEFVMDMVRSLKELKNNSGKDDIAGTACSIHQRQEESEENTDDQSGANDLPGPEAGDKIAELETRIEQLMLIVQANAEQHKKLEKEIRELNNVLRSESWWASLIRSSGSSSTLTTGTREYVNATFLTPEERNLTVKQVWLNVAKLKPGADPTLLSFMVVPLNVVGFLGCLIAGVVAWVVVGSEAARKSVFFVANMTFFPCHYWVTITLSNGEVCTLERSAETSDTAEPCANLKSGVRLFWGDCSSREGSLLVPNTWIYSCFATPVTLSDLLDFCDSERFQQYDAWNNNGKHFCYNLLQTVFDQETDLSFAEFTGYYNG